MLFLGRLAADLRKEGVPAVADTSKLFYENNAFDQIPSALGR